MNEDQQPQDDYYLYSFLLFNLFSIFPFTLAALQLYTSKSQKIPPQQSTELFYLFPFKSPTLVFPGAIHLCSQHQAVFNRSEN